jgi:hypothetical protein
MSAGDGAQRACDLCGLDVGAQPFVLHIREKTLQFCCEGCRGIYQMLHNIDDTPEPTTTRHGGDS